MDRWIGELGRIPAARTHHSTSPPTHQFVDVTQYRDIIGVAIPKAIEGATSEAVLAEAHKDFQKLLDRTDAARARASPDGSCRA